MNKGKFFQYLGANPFLETADPNQRNEFELAKVCGVDPIFREIYEG